VAAEYIAYQFKQAGLSPITPEGSYFQYYTAVRGQVTAAPMLEVLDAEGRSQLVVTDGISLDPLQAFNAEGSTEIEFVVTDRADRSTVLGLDGEGLLLLDPEADAYRPWTGPWHYGAIVRVVPDSELASNDQPPPFDLNAYSSMDRLPRFPNLLIGESAARQLLAQAEMDLEELQAAVEQGEAVKLHTGLRVRLTYGLVYEEVRATNVIGYIAGLDLESQAERILVTATYTGPPPRDGQTYPGADENASGVATMLETARLLHDLGVVPKRTVVFAAFDEVGGSQFVQSPALPTRSSNTWTGVILHGLGAGEARLARLEEGSGFARAFDQSARRFGVRTQTLDGWQFFFISNYSRLSWSDVTIPTSYQGLVVTRPGDSLSGTPSDTLDHVDSELLAKAGRAVAHYVMVLSSR
jgi:hypothetical protein